MRRILVTTMVSILAVVSLASAVASPALATIPWWHLMSGSRPGYLKPGGEGVIVVTATNLGEISVNGEGSPVEIVDHLPSGLTAGSVDAEAGNYDHEGPVECRLKPEIRCTFEHVLSPFRFIEVRITVKVKTDASSGETNVVNVTGGQAPSASISRPITVSSEPTPFGVEDYEQRLEEEGGATDTQAGSHPFQFTTALTLNQTAQTTTGNVAPGVNPVALAKDLTFRLPPGLIGNPEALPRCTSAQFFSFSCSPQTIIGAGAVTVNEPGLVGLTKLVFPVFNLEPDVGEPARFGFLPFTNETPVYIDTSVRTGEDYGITAHVDNINQLIAFTSSEVTLWGVPGDPRHDHTRGYGCLGRAVDGERPCDPLEENNPAPFFELPTSCTGPLVDSIEADSWSEPLHPVSLASSPLPALDGCNRLPFEPSLEVEPDVPDASASTGLTVNVKVPQEASLNPAGLGEADVRDTTVALPPGVAINPSGGDGLEACPNDLIGFEGTKEYATLPGVQTPTFTPRVPGGTTAKEAGETALFEPGINFCSNASKIGTARIKTPILEHELKGAVYLGPQEANPFGSLVAMYIVVEDPISGVLLKLPGEVALCKSVGEVLDEHSCEALGQVVTTFLNTPQAPAEEIELHFFGGERAPLATPARCGSYTTSTSIVPWSASEHPNPDEVVYPSSTFPISAGPSGGSCPGASLPFDPSLTGGATDLQAGGFSPFTLTMSRSDGEQNLQSVEAHLPPGLSGILSNIEQCPEPQANEGACGPGSLIGETTVSVGVGGQPFSVRGGRFYLTGPYNGTGACTPGTPGCAPFGLSFVVPAKAGPFDLAKTKLNHPACDCVLVRGKIEVNPITSALTITSDPPGTPDAIPTSIEGIPLEIQHVNATTTRSDFQFNPTNCSRMEVTGTIHSSEGGTDTIGVPFQVTNCAALKFQPKFSVSTSGKTSKANGAGLTVKLTYPDASFGSQANIARVKVELPKQLPSRLTTLQKACPSAQFDANPAGCPPASIVGHAKAITPLIPVPLEGPAYFVSHGGEAFPSLVIVLQGYNVTIDLVGSTFINEKTGVTSSTFKTVPDQPVGSFELTLPQGKYSALAANANLCKVKKLAMPTEFVGQNGAEIHETTKIQVTGCPKAKHARKAKKSSKHKRKPASRSKKQKH
jgi:hypothetical protein